MANDPTPSPTSEAAAAGATLPPPRRRRAAAVALVLALIVATIAGGAVLWLARSAAGTAWLLAQVPGLTVRSPQGVLLGGAADDTLRAARLQWQGAAGELTIDDLRLDGLDWSWRPQPGAWVGLTLRLAQARHVRWQSHPSTTPLTAPTSLQLPLALTIEQLAVDGLDIDALPPVSALRARLALGADDGRVHRLDDLHATLAQAAVQGQAQIGTEAPLVLDATLQATRLATAGGSSPAAQSWSAQAQGRGPLAGFTLLATLRGATADGPSLDAQGRVAPFAAWPVPELELSTRALDLAALWPRAPHTRLDGQARVRSRGLGVPADLELTLTNAEPGAWNADRLPLALARLRAQGVPQPAASTTATLDIAELTLDLADRRGGAGRLSGSGQWRGDTLALTTRWTAVQPSRLDERAPAMVLDGPVAATLSGLPSPSVLGGSHATIDANALQLALDARLAGQGSGAAPALRGGAQLVLQGRASRLAIDLGRQEAPVELRAGGARATGTLQARRAAVGEPWHLQSQGELVQFDPRTWWPGAEGGAWRAGPHRLQGRWQAGLSLDPAVSVHTPVDRLRQLHGQAALTLDDSVLAGVAVSGRLTLDHPQDAAALSLDLRAADARLQAGGRLAPRPEDDHWTVDIDAPHAAALAPLARLAPELQAWWPVAGALQTQATIDGRWPLLVSRGTLRAQGLRAAASQASAIDARWQLGSADDAPWELRLDASGLQREGQRIDRVAVTLTGSRRQHQAQVEVDTPLRPPAWTENLLGPAGVGTRARLQGSGQWQPEAGGGQWRGQLAQLDLSARTAAGTTNAAPSDRPWFDVRDIAAELHFDAQGALRDGQLMPGRAQLPGGAALRWTQARWQAGTPDRLDVQAELEPLAVAALLAKAQPDFGWSGDLRLGARIDIHALERFEADVVVERQGTGGDLKVTDEAGTTQALGLTDLRLGLAARDGQWQFTVAAAGQQLGEMAGAVVVRDGDAQRRWPSAQAPMDGVIEMRVANLGTWGAWVPPGWRLAGSLRTSATFGGRFGAPEVRGDLRGQGLGARHLLQGIHFSDGELAASLEGATARIETFRFKGGDGTLALTGGATFGESPSLDLHLVAERFRAFGRLDRRLVVSALADLQVRNDQVSLTGRADVDEGLFDFSRSEAPGLDADVSVQRGTAAAGDEPASAARTPRLLAASTRVDLRIGLGQALRLRGRGLDAVLGGELRLQDQNRRVALNGTVRAERGSYIAYGQRMEIERGEVVFVGSTENPRLDIRAVRPNLDVKVGVDVTGTAQAPRIRLFSEPDLSDLDKLSWLVLGRSSDGLGRTDTALLQRAAIALLAGEGEAPTDNLIHSLGLTDFSVRQTEGDVRETVVSLGRQLSRRWYVGYERGMNATSGTWQLVYRIAQRFTLRAQSGQENAIDLIWQWRW